MPASVQSQLPGVQLSPDSATKVRASVRFGSLDALRGLAALVVVLYHWRHFLLFQSPSLLWPGENGPLPSAEPGYLFLKPIYELGYYAVDLFFVISGFIFVAFYQRSIAERRTSGKDFFVFRFSRLYPLHLVSLILIAALQGLFIARAGEAFVYGDNDLAHFVANLFVINIPKETFNGPVWSLSVEICLYAIFFFFARVKLLAASGGYIVLAAGGIALSALSGDLANQIGHGMTEFFLGGLMAKLLPGDDGKAQGKRAFDLTSDLAFNLLLGLVLSGWLLTLGAIYANLDVGSLLPLESERLRQFLVTRPIIYVLFPATVLLVALRDKRGALSSPFAHWLGSISYSSYLLHFPLQVVLALLIVWGALPTSLGKNALALCLYFAVLLGASTVSYRAFEVPAQAWLRRKFVSRTRTSQSAAAHEQADRKQAMKP